MFGQSDENQAVQATLVEVINDEYRAQAVYGAVIASFGPATPFVNIHRAEGRHIAALVALFYKYGFSIPPDGYAGNVEAPASIAQACQLGVDAEIANYQMYDRLAANMRDPQVIDVFIKLRNASYENHLRAFQACVARSGTWHTQNTGAYTPQGVPPLSSINMLVPALGVLAGGALIWWMVQNTQAREMPEATV